MCSLQQARSDCPEIYASGDGPSYPIQESPERSNPSVATQETESSPLPPALVPRIYLDTVHEDPPGQLDIFVQVCREGFARSGYRGEFKAPTLDLGSEETSQGLPQGMLPLPSR